MTLDPLMLTCAFRYALTRHTYVTGAAVDWVKDAWPTLRPGERGVIKRDLDQHIAEHKERELSDACSGIDMRGWLELQEWIGERT